MLVKSFLLIGLLVCYSTAKSVDLPSENRNQTREDESHPEHEIPDLTEVIREVENVQETFLRNLSEEMKKIDLKLQRIRDRHEEELQKSRRFGGTRPPIKMTFEVSVPGHEKEVKTFDLVSNGNPKIVESPETNLETRDSTESEETEDARRGKELEHEPKETLHSTEQEVVPRESEEKSEEREQPESGERSGKGLTEGLRSTTETPSEKERQENELEQPKPEDKGSETTTHSSDKPEISEGHPSKFREPSKQEEESESAEHKPSELESDERKKAQEKGERKQKPSKQKDGSSSSESRSSSQESSEENLDLMTAPSGANIVITLPTDSQQKEGEVTIKVLPKEGEAKESTPKSEEQPPLEPITETSITTEKGEQDRELPSSGTRININLPSEEPQQEDEIKQVIIRIDTPQGSNNSEDRDKLPIENQEVTDRTTTSNPIPTRRSQDGKRRPTSRRCPEGMQFNVITQDCGSPNYGTGHLSYYWYVSKASSQQNPFMNLFGFRK